MPLHFFPDLLRCRPCSPDDLGRSVVGKIAHDAGRKSSAYPLGEQTLAVLSYTAAHLTVFDTGILILSNKKTQRLFLNFSKRWGRFSPCSVFHCKLIKGSQERSFPWHQNCFS